MNDKSANGLPAQTNNPYFYRGRGPITGYQLKISRTNTWIAWGIIAASIAVLLRRVLLMELDSFEFDDAFMFIRYAENLLHGEGYTWNAGDPPVFGVTSILYTWAVAAAKWLFGGVAGNTRLLVGTAFVFGAAFLLRLTEGLYRNVRAPLLKSRLVIGLLTVPFLLLPLIFAFHISTGMGTTLSLFLHTCLIFGVIAYSREEQFRWRTLVPAALFAYLVYLARPDNALAAVLFPAMYLVSRRQYRHAARLAAVTVFLFAGDAAVKFLVFGDILPLSYYAKKSGFTEGYTAKYFWNPVKYITEFTAYLTPFILSLFLFTRRKDAGMLLSFLLPAALTFAYFCGFDQIMGFHARFYFPFIPYVIVPAFILLDNYLSSAPDKRGDHWSADLLFRKLAFLLLFLFLTVYSKYRFINMYERWAVNEGHRTAVSIRGLDDRKYDREESIRRISDLLKEFPDDFVFAATEHGFISGDNPGKRILDLSGLHHRTIAHQGYSDSLMEAESPDFVWMPHQDLTVLHHKVRTGPYFSEHYEYITDEFAFGIGVRRDGPYYSELMAIIRGEASR